MHTIKNKLHAIYCDITIITRVLLLPLQLRCRDGSLSTSLTQLLMSSLR